jgi:hypothetical protein
VNKEDYKTVKPVKRVVKQGNPAELQQPHLWGVTKVSDLDDIIME